MAPRWAMGALRVLVVAWASPGTLAGLVLLALARASGGVARRHEGTLEVHGGAPAALMSFVGGPTRGVQAVTLGHVIIGCDARTLEHFREHERTHVRQWERWGPLFPPVYLAASLWAWLRGRDAYLANHFEREARGERRDSEG